MGKNKTVLVTGASCGIGKSTAILFAENNYNVIINYFQSEIKAKNLEKELLNKGLSAIAIRADVSKYSEVSCMVEKAYKMFGNIDVLVNNAGIAQTQNLITTTTEEEWDKLFSINVKGMFNCCKAILPYMINRHSGKIINVSSIWGITGASCEVAYSSSKAAIHGFTKALAKEVGPSNINVNCIAPGIIDTEMNSNIDSELLQELINETPLCKIGTPLDIAKAILFLASNDSNFLTGQIISPNGGFVI